MFSFAALFAFSLLISGSAMAAPQTVAAPVSSALVSTPLPSTTVDLASGTTDLPSAATVFSSATTDLASIVTDIPSETADIPSEPTDIPSEPTDIPSETTDLASAAIDPPNVTADTPVATAAVLPDAAPPPVTFDGSDPASDPASVPPPIASDACTAARLDTLLGLFVSSHSVALIDSTDPNTRTALRSAGRGFVTVEDGVSAIAFAILTNQAPPTDARDQVGRGLIQVKSALLGLDVSDPNVEVAAQAIDVAIEAANRVLISCN